MSRTPLYRPTERTLFVRTHLTAAQYDHLCELLGVLPGRFKSWADLFVFGLPATAEPCSERALAYLCEQELPHDVETLTTWDSQKVPRHEDSR